MKGKDLLIGFALGLGVGSLFTYILTLGKRAEKESIEEKKESDNDKKEEQVIMQNSKKKDFYDYSKIYQTSKTEKKDKDKVEEQQKDLVGPYVVSPQEYDEHPSYIRTSFRYYADGILADDDNEEISMIDAERLIGKDALKHFGEYEDDAVHVINHERGTIYEILLDDRRYSDVRSSMPRRVEIKRNDETEND